MDWKVIVSTLVGGAITFAATTGQEMLKNRRIRRAAVLSVGVEIAAGLDIVNARGWASDIRMCIEQASQGNVVRLTILLPRETIPCCRNALANGTLGDGVLTGLVASFVMAVDGLKADLDRLFEYDFGDPKCIISADDPDHALKLYLELLGLVSAIESFGLDALDVAAKNLARDGAWLRLRHGKLAARHRAQ